MKKIDDVLFKQMIISGANNLYNNYPDVDSLNVFPVPDGDTGTNMNLTMQSGINEVFNKKSKGIDNVAADFAWGLLNGARGNSGVILSQIFAGFSDSLKGKTDIDAFELADAFVQGTRFAYKSVITPVEGTILTVIREASDALYERVELGMNMATAMDFLLNEAQKSLEHTPELLPVLKEVGVVDSGGYGLCKVLEGFAKALHNKIVEKEMATVTTSAEAYSSGKPQVVMGPKGSVQAQFSHDEFGYCTQFLLKLQDQNNLKDKKAFNDKRFKAVLEAHGNSIVFIHQDDLVKVHIHTMKPGLIFSYAQQFGEFKTMKCDNMSEQHEELLNDFSSNSDEQSDIGTHEVALKAAATAPKNDVRKKYALIAVCVGKGVEQMFKESSVDYFISGGQTMNPSTEDFVKVIKSTNADHIFIFPNNSNIIMAANQAKEIVKNDYDVTVIPTKAILEGLTACMMFSPEMSVEENLNEMLDNIKTVKSGEITYSVKDTKIDGIDVKKNQFIAMAHKNLVACNSDREKVLFSLVEDLIDEDASMLTVICGEDVSSKTQDKIRDQLTKKYSDNFDVLVAQGDQPVYSYFVSVE